mmetsp:Transcript_49573/g.91444  ORF Transcript_49573/g.91444 Transcript_49573/m.91444 type:complete len:529 (-) Transcript_49573:36-1622(-)
MVGRDWYVPLVLLVCACRSALSLSIHKGHIAEDARGPIAQEGDAFDKFGRPHYDDDWPAPTWSDIAGESSLGTVCDADEELPCGRVFVCRDDVCRHCVRDRECPSWHHCVSNMNGRNLCMPMQRKAWEEVYHNPWELLCTILVFLASVLSAAAGVGGGGMFVPLLMLFSGMKTDEAIPLSQIMVLGSSAVNLAFFVGQWHPTFPNSAKIDYDCAVVAEPMLCLGVSLGVLSHAIVPDWFMLLLLALTLGMALHRTVQKGVKQWREENKLDDEPEGYSPSLRTHRRNSSYLTHVNARQIFLLMGVWLAWLLLPSLRLKVCSLPFLFLMMAACIATVACTLAVGKWILRTADERPMEWSMPDASYFDIMRFPLVSWCAGWIGGLLGIGGGLIMSPVLLEVGMHSEAVQATTAVFVFLSSSLATVQFALLSKHVWHYSLWYCSVTIAATLVGQKLCNVYVQRHKRYSLVTLAIAAVMLFSLAAISIMGIDNILEGGRWSFSLSRLCHASSSSIITKDVAPVRPFPTDLRAR